MRIQNLYKIELYRFVHSYFIFVCMIAGFLVTLFLASHNSDALMGDGTSVGTVTATMKVANLIVVLVVSVAISNYVGREFKQKTIYYEVMRGYKLWEISVIKSITCGIVLPVMLELCILIFYVTIPGTLELFAFTHILFMFFILWHICSCTTLYVLLCKNGSLGGCLAFVRFTLLEVMILFVLKPFMSNSLYNSCKPLFIMSQWSAVINADFIIPVEYMSGIIGGAVIEYFVLIVLIQVYSKKNDL